MSDEYRRLALAAVERAESAEVERYQWRATAKNSETERIALQTHAEAAEAERDKWREAYNGVVAHFTEVHDKQELGKPKGRFEPAADLRCRAERLEAALDDLIITSQHQQRANDELRAKLDAALAVHTAHDNGIGAFKGCCVCVGCRMAAKLRGEGDR